MPPDETTEVDCHQSMAAGPCATTRRLDIMILGIRADRSLAVVLAPCTRYGLSVLQRRETSWMILVL